MIRFLVTAALIIGGIYLGARWLVGHAALPVGYGGSAE
jgi:hypothetical protein